MNDTHDAPAERRHPIQVVVRRTGLSADRIRMWERRYGAVSPQRAATNRRLYSEEDIERLLLLRKATLHGRRIGQLADLETVELAALVERDEAALSRAPAPSEPSGAGRSAASLLADCLGAVAALDASGLQRLLARARLDLTPPALIERLLLPMMRGIGELWRRGELRIAHEHLAEARG